MEKNCDLRREELSGILTAMTDKHLSQSVLAQKMGVTQSQISLWLSGKVNIRLDTFIRLKKAVGPEKLVDGYFPSGEIVENVLCDEREVYGRPATFGGLVKDALYKNNMTQAQLAEKVGTSQSRISEYIRGAVVPSLPVAAKICKILGINSRDFIEICSKM